MDEHARKYLERPSLLSCMQQGARWRTPPAGEDSGDGCGLLPTPPDTATYGNAERERETDRVGVGGAERPKGARGGVQEGLRGSQEGVQEGAQGASGRRRRLDSRNGQGILTQVQRQQTKRKGAKAQQDRQEPKATTSPNQHTINYHSFLVLCQH